MTCVYLEMQAVNSPVLGTVDVALSEVLPYQDRRCGQSWVASNGASRGPSRNPGKGFRLTCVDIHSNSITTIVFL